MVVSDSLDLYVPKKKCTSSVVWHIPISNPNRLQIIKHNAYRSSHTLAIQKSFYRYSEGKKSNYILCVSVYTVYIYIFILCVYYVYIMYRDILIVMLLQEKISYLPNFMIKIKYTCSYYLISITSAYIYNLYNTIYS